MINGFKVGPACVTPLIEIEGRVAISIDTDAGKSVHVYVSRAGRSIRVFSGNQEWTPPAKPKASPVIGDPVYLPPREDGENVWVEPVEMPDGTRKLLIRGDNE